MPTKTIYNRVIFPNPRRGIPSDGDNDDGASTATESREAATSSKKFRRSISRSLSRNIGSDESDVDYSSTKGTGKLYDNYSEEGGGGGVLALLSSDLKDFIGDGIPRHEMVSGSMATSLRTKDYERNHLGDEMTIRVKRIAEDHLGYNGYHRKKRGSRSRPRRRRKHPEDGDGQEVSTSTTIDNDALVIRHHCQALDRSFASDEIGALSLVTKVGGSNGNENDRGGSSREYGKKRRCTISSNITKPSSASSTTKCTNNNPDRLQMLPSTNNTITSNPKGETYDSLIICTVEKGKDEGENDSPLLKNGDHTTLASVEKGMLPLFDYNSKWTKIRRHRTSRPRKSNASTFNNCENDYNAASGGSVMHHQSCSSQSSNVFDNDQKTTGKVKKNGSAYLGEISYNCDKEETRSVSKMGREVNTGGICSSEDTKPKSKSKRRIYPNETARKDDEVDTTKSWSNSKRMNSSRTRNRLIPERMLSSAPIPSAQSAALEINRNDQNLASTEKDKDNMLGPRIMSTKNRRGRSSSLSLSNINVLDVPSSSINEVTDSLSRSQSYGERDRLESSSGAESKEIDIRSKKRSKFRNSYFNIGMGKNITSRKVMSIDDAKTSYQDELCNGESVENRFKVKSKGQRNRIRRNLLDDFSSVDNGDKLSEIGALGVISVDESLKNSCQTTFEREENRKLDSLVLFIDENSKGNSHKGGVINSTKLALLQSSTLVSHELSSSSDDKGGKYREISNANEKLNNMDELALSSSGILSCQSEAETSINGQRNCEERMHRKRNITPEKRFTRNHLNDRHKDDNGKEKSKVHNKNIHRIGQVQRLTDEGILVAHNDGTFSKTSTPKPTQNNLRNKISHRKKRVPRKANVDKPLLANDIMSKTSSINIERKSDGIGVKEKSTVSNNGLKMSDMSSFQSKEISCIVGGSTTFEKHTEGNREKANTKKPLTPNAMRSQSKSDVSESTEEKCTDSLTEMSDVYDAVSTHTISEVSNINCKDDDRLLHQSFAANESKISKESCREEKSSLKELAPTLESESDGNRSNPKLIVKKRLASNTSSLEQHKLKNSVKSILTSDSEQVSSAGKRTRHSGRKRKPPSYFSPDISSGKASNGFHCKQKIESKVFNFSKDEKIHDYYKENDIKRCSRKKNLEKSPSNHDSSLNLTPDTPSTTGTERNIQAQHRNNFESIPRSRSSLNNGQGDDDVLQRLFGPQREKNKIAHCKKESDLKNDTISTCVSNVPSINKLNVDTTKKSSNTQIRPGLSCEKISASNCINDALSSVTETERILNVSEEDLKQMEKLLYIAHQRSRRSMLHGDIDIDSNSPYNSDLESGDFMIRPPPQF